MCLWNLIVEVEIMNYVNNVSNGFSQRNKNQATNIKHYQVFCHKTENQRAKIFNIHTVSFKKQIISHKIENQSAKIVNINTFEF